MRRLAGQSDLLGTVITVSLVLVLGIAGMAFSISWASSRQSEAMFTSFAEGFSSDLQAVLLPSGGSSSSLHVLVLRIGVADANYALYVSAYKLTQPQYSWQDLGSPLQVGYNLSSLGLGRGTSYNLTFNPSAVPENVAGSSLYVKRAGSWHSLRDLGHHGSLSLSRMGVMGPSDVLVVNVSYTPADSAGYLLLVLWARYNDRYVGVPFVFSVAR